MKSPRRENFAFDIPALMRPGEEMPPSFSLSKLMEGGIRGRASVEVVDVAYRVIALWESHDGSENRVMLEAPFLFRPDTEFHSLDGGSLDPESWLEVPLVSDRQIPFQCAVTMPNPATFPRSASLPYFVVYTTTPKSVPLSREIAADATIAVSLVRQIMIKQEHPLRSRSSSADEDSDVQLVTVPRNKLYKRAASKTAPARFPTFGRVNEKNTLQGLCDRPLPPLPGEQRKTRGAFSESRTLQTDIFVGFPKRPRNPGDPRGHPSLEEHISLPDGLYKGRLPLHRDMIPTISWGGLQVKYYLDISVLFGQDELRARVPIRLF
ncbi:hypothetical protein PUNSTDRAFT_103055 [Punctularia strigosozonata HHB-11173 SS5]|uniref:uncharacterized protein n=1 Tax=Punctularia strigosozonata (strain HHB-11173) TaxID=741275 RepID=UPI0004416564|nr:uncharacterized protein PUNSTDRAFT_103055 [Punctularia strigosozonata HHB-11173 SS5]EIN08270.1 hypothetical protein PUNSTDRAFT_103055 [Punctularia strigosozonata HHB-11173 SS5]